MTEIVRPPGWKKESSESARMQIEKARIDNKDAETMLHEAGMAQPEKLGLPTTWGDRSGPINVAGPEARIVAPSDDDIATYALSRRGAVCGSCKYFDLENGRTEIIRQRFVERLVRDEEWKMHHIGPIDALGLCGASGGETACSVVTEACDQYRPKRTKGRLKGA